MTTPLRVGIEGRDDSGRAFDSARRSLDQLAKKTKEWIGTLSQLSQLSRNVTAGARSLAQGFASVMAPSQQLVRLEVQLAGALAKTGQLTDEAYAKVVRFASARQDVTTFSRAVTLQMATIGAEFGLTADQMVVAIEAIQDRSIQLARNPVELFRSYARAVVGIGDEWTELGLRVGKTLTTQERLQTTVQQMRSGISEAIAKLPTSAWEQLTNQFVNIADGIGRVVASTRTFQTAMQWLRGFARAIEDALSNPEKLDEFAKKIDAAFLAVARGAAGAISTLLRYAAKFAVGIEGAMRFLDRFTGEDKQKRIAELTSQLQSLQARIGDAVPTDPALAQALRAITSQISVLQQDVPELSGSLNSLADSFLEFSLVGEIAGNFESVASSVRTLNAALREGQGAPPIPKETLDAYEGLIRRLNEEMQSFGDEFSSVLSGAFQRAFDKDVGARQAFRDLGGDVVKTFVGQFSDSAFAPLSQTFGQLAKTLAAPFAVVGNVINGILAPITGFISKILTYLIEQLFSIIGIQKLAAVTGLASATTVNAAAAGMATAWGAAAVAASIATLGAALSSAPAAMSAISSGAALTASLAIPKAAQGAFVEPRPGGTLVRVAEAGQAEVIAPMPKLEGALARVLSAYGGGGGGLNVNFTGDVSFGGERAARELADELGGHLAMTRGRDRWRR